MKFSSRLTVVYCGQWGSTGKGNVVAKVAEEDAAAGFSIVGVRVGGPNAGHTFQAANGEVVSVQQIPIPAYISPNAMAMVGAAGLILPEVFDRELRYLIQMYKDLGWGAPQVVIDRGATIITQEHMDREGGLKSRISSTGEGVGAATADRVMRRAKVVGRFEGEQGEQLGGGIEELREQYPESFGRKDVVWVSDTVGMLNRMFSPDGQNGLRDNPLTLPRSVIVEGTQGTLLSLYTGGYYPYCTSREVTPDAILSQVGLSRHHTDRLRIIMTMRTYPIRVGGPSGPLPHEVTWEELAERTEGYIEPEKTTVTKKIRRIAEIDYSIMQKVILQTRPTEIALTFADYRITPNQSGADAETMVANPPLAAAHLQSLLQEVRTELGSEAGISYVGYGKTQKQYISFVSNS